MKEKFMNKLTRKFILILTIAILLITGTAFAFNDVAKSAWYYDAVTRLSELGIMNGKDNGNFDPNGTITRAEMAAIMVNTIDYIEQSNQNQIDQSVANILSAVKSSGYIVSGNKHGSGILIDNSGLMLTAYHVVDSPDGLGVRVSFDDSDKKYSADVVYKNESYDLALIQVYGAGIRKSIPISKSEVKILDRIYAIGNPFGLTNSISSGIVSKLDVKINNKIIPHIQMDITINAGNSGGAIVNSNGELIGIALSSVIASEGGFGIGFAVGLDEINEVIENYKND